MEEKMANRKEIPLTESGVMQITMGITIKEQEIFAWKN
jgi:hypothetical protein